MSNYKKEIQVLTSANTYSEAIDITDRLVKDGLGGITQQLDGEEYDFGKVAFGDLEIELENINGDFTHLKLSSNSIFLYDRDKTRFTLKYFDQTGVERIRFKGLIREDSIRQDFKNGTISMIVTGVDSILNTTLIPTGTISNGDGFLDAMESVFDLPDVAAVIPRSTSSTVSLDLAIDDGTAFDGIPAIDAIQALLIASGSTLFVDPDDGFLIQGRDTAPGGDGLMLFVTDPADRDNVINFFDINTGYHRVFNSIDVDGTVSRHGGSINLYGLREKSISVPGINSIVKREQIGQNIVTLMKDAKIEMQITMETEKTARIKINHEVTLLVGLHGTNLRGFDISDGTTFRIFGIFESLVNETTTLFLREV